MKNKSDVIYEVLAEVNRLIDSRFHILPIVYGSLGVELALSKDYDAHDIDIILPDAIAESDDLKILLRKAGFRRVEKPYLAYKKHGFEIEIATWSYWVKAAGLVELPPLSVIKDDHTFNVLALKNQWLLYKYLVYYNLRSDIKRERDRLKLHDLELVVKKRPE